MGKHRGVIDRHDALETFLPCLNQAEWTALDTEADSLYAYPEKLCLVQLSVPGRDVLVDPLAACNLAPLWAALQNRELILHGADYDLRLLYRGHGFVPRAIFDTMIAARLLGQKEFSLSSLVRRHLGVNLEKGPQKANWARRPLSQRMEEYARNDTRYLKPLETLLRAQLREQGRLRWLVESCARLVLECSQPEAPDPDRVWRVKGSHLLAPPALAVLREIWHWREREAVAANRPPYFILSHETLVGVAVAAVNGQSLEPLLPVRFSPRRQTELLQAVQAGLALPAEQQPKLLRSVSHRLLERERRRFHELEKRRNRRALELHIDPALIASRAMLVALARHDGPQTVTLMPWQQELLG